MIAFLGTEAFATIPLFNWEVRLKLWAKNCTAGTTSTNIWRVFNRSFGSWWSFFERNEEMINEASNPPCHSPGDFCEDQQICCHGLFWKFQVITCLLVTTPCWDPWMGLSDPLCKALQRKTFCLLHRDESSFYLFLPWLAGVLDVLVGRFFLHFPHKKNRNFWVFKFWGPKILLFLTSINSTSYCYLFNFWCFYFATTTTTFSITWKIEKPRN